MLVSCEMCEKELPIEDALALETEDALLWFCSGDCLEAAVELESADAGAEDGDRR